MTPRLRCQECGSKLRFDADARGFTCGGLELQGWDVCSKCGVAWVSVDSVPIPPPPRIPMKDRKP